MNRIKVRSILQKYSWATPRGLFNEENVHNEVDNYLNNWQLELEQLELVDKLFEEIENWFEKNNKPLDVKIYGVTWLFDTFRIDLSSNTREIFAIVDKYKEFSRDLYYKDDNDDYEDEF